MLRVLDLFSGIGGFSLGLERTGGFETVAFCEIEDFPRRVLAKHWPEVPVFHDVRKLTAEDTGPVDVICGGYPCQPFSTAGRRRGKEDDRHLWPEFSRLVAEHRPAWVIGENVAGHISMGLDDVLSDLEGQGYACRAFVIPACAVDAPHRRDRVWVVGHTRGGRPAGQREGRARMARDGLVSRGRDQAPNQFARSGAHVADADRNDVQGQQPRRADAKERARPLPRQAGPLLAGPRRVWRAEPDVGRVAHGISRRVDRLRALGNAVVPQIPEMIGHAILQAEAEHGR